MLRDELRTATREHHDRLERRLDILDSIGSRADYTHLLARFYGLYVPLEAQILAHEAPLREHGVDVRARLKAQKIELDLRVLGWTRASIAQLPLCAELPRLSTRAHAFGCLYVLEGSTLGAQVVASHVALVLKLEGDTGLGFLRAYGSQTARMWRAFVDGINAYPATQAEVEQTSHAAQATFEAMERWLIPPSSTRSRRA